jgi:hypothetical protein
VNDDDFATLLEWYVEGFLGETPTNPSRRGVWHADYDVHVSGRLSTPAQLAGGSALGSPDQPMSFRRYIEDSPYAKARGGAFARPFRAALAEMTGRHRCRPSDRVPGHDCGSSPLMARYLYALGMAQGDWRTLGAQWDIVPSYRKAYTWTALKRFEGRYSSYPLRTSWVDKSQAQQRAEETA